MKSRKGFLKKGLLGLLPNLQIGCLTCWLKKKPNGKLRICFDPSQTVNKTIKRPKYTIPTIEEKPPLLTKAKVFPIVDVSEAFHTIVLDEKSPPLTTFQGPNGRHCYNRMPFGIASGPEEYQRRQREFLNGLRGVINIADDIACMGVAKQMKTLTSTTTETWRSSWRSVLNTIYGSLQIKLQLKSPSITFMGHKAYP